MLALCHIIVVLNKDVNPILSCFAQIDYKRIGVKYFKIGQPPLDQFQIAKAVVIFLKIQNLGKIYRKITLIVLKIKD